MDRMERREGKPGTQLYLNTLLSVSGGQFALVDMDGRWEGAWLAGHNVPSTWWSLQMVRLQWWPGIEARLVGPLSKRRRRCWLDRQDCQLRLDREQDRSGDGVEMSGDSVRKGGDIVSQDITVFTDIIGQYGLWSHIGIGLDTRWSRGSES